MIVMKFGGTSVGDASRLRRAAGLVAERRDERPLVVVSALSGVTNRLLRAAAAAEARDEASLSEDLQWIRARHLDVLAALELSQDVAEPVRRDVARCLARLEEVTRGVLLVRECSPRSRDAVAATGELISMHLVAAALRDRGVAVEVVDPRRLVRTDDRFGEAEVDREAIGPLVAAEVAPRLQRGGVVVTGGYVGATAEGVTTTLGRGGSDLSATLLGVALDARRVEIWTDVNGMMTADPRVVPRARTLPDVTFQEAAELAYFGAKVLHPATIRPAVERRIPVRVLNSLEPGHAGTTIRDAAADAADGPSCVRAVAWKTGIATVHLSSPRMLGAHGFLARVFSVFEREGTPVDVVTTSEVSVSVTVDRPERLDRIAEDLGKVCQVRVDRGMALVCLVGRRLLEDPALVGEILSTLAGIPLRMFCLGSSDINLTLVVPDHRAEEAVRRLHARFLEEPAA